jgi:hypothetical protein
VSIDFNFSGVMSVQKTILLIMVSLLVLFACNAKTAKSITSAKSEDVSNAEVTAAKSKFPDASLETLKKGYSLYYGASCTRCHEPKNIIDFSEEELPDIITRMARKAKITTGEKDAVLKYVMGVRIAAKN